MTGWAYDEDRAYHGVRDEDGEARIFVELSEFGPTERKLDLVVLAELRPQGMFEDYGFGWGYNGGGTSAAADAILRDAFGQPPSDQLREDFCEDVLSQFHKEWRFRRGAVLRWARGWCAQHEVEILPAAVVNLPPVYSHHYEPRPPRRR